MAEYYIIPPSAREEQKIEVFKFKPQTLNSNNPHLAGVFSAP